MPPNRDKKKNIFINYYKKNIYDVAVVIMSPLNNYIVLLSNTQLVVDTGYNSSNKTEFFWIAYGIIS